MKRQIDNKIIECSDEFSNKILTIPFVDIPDDTIVYGSSFYQEDMPDAHVFRDEMKGVTFYHCNLDNCFIPKGNTVIGGANRRIKAQNDLNDWEVDENLNLIKPVNADIMFEKHGLPVPKPEDIPTEKCEQIVDLIKVAEELKEAEVNPK